MCDEWCAYKKKEEEDDVAMIDVVGLILHEEGGYLWPTGDRDL